MQTKQATGLDTRMMSPVYAGVFCIICQCFLPWINIPALRYSRMPTGYRIFQMATCVSNFQKSLETGGKLEMAPLTAEEIASFRPWILTLQIAAGVMVLLLAACAVTVLIKRTAAKPLVYVTFSLQALMAAFEIVLLTLANVWLNNRMGRGNSFFNLTVRSWMQLTSWVYAQLLVSALLLAFADRLMTIRDEGPKRYQERTAKKDRRIGKRTWTAVVLIVVAIPLVIFFGIFFLNDRSAVFIGICIVCLAMLPFAMVFEDRKPQARELLLIAVMAGIAVAGRAAFFWLPQFKPVAAVVIIAGVGLGAEAGFLTGAVSAFASNFFFGQGPWAPWQMFCFGIIGFLAGILFHRNKWLAKKSEKVRRFWICLYGGLSVWIIYGLIMDFSTIISFSSGFSWSIFLARIISGFYFNMVHALATVFFLLYLSRPMERKLDRIKKKYGILEV